MSAIHDFPSEFDVYCMRLALREAERGARDGEAPVGAVVAREGTALASAHDLRQSTGDPTAHAEMLALGAAGRALGDWRLDGCDLYVTLEPCPMCAGAILLARIRRLIYGAPNCKSGAVETHCRLLDIDTFNHRVEIRSGMMAEQSAMLLKEFFAQLRSNVRKK